MENYSLDTYKKPTYMPDDVFEQLILILDSPVLKWTKACGMKKPRWYQFYKIEKFIKAVNVTKHAIRATLSYEFYPESYIPRVDISFITSRKSWSFDVHTWGPWEECKI